MIVGKITNWRKASGSAQESSACVETGWTGSTVGYRDSKQVGGPELWFQTTAARLFIARIKDEGFTTGV